MKDSYKINKGFIVQNIGKKMTIFDPEESIIYTFNETASFIFSKIKRRETLDNIAQAVSSKFAVDKENSKKDIELLLKELMDKKILIS